MDELKQALRELQDVDSQLHYEDENEQASYIMSIARRIIENEQNNQ